MNSLTRTLTIPLLAFAISASSARAAPDARTAGAGRSPAEHPAQWWQGFRVGFFALPLLRLQDRERSLSDSFLGTITRLEERGGGFPVHPFVEYVAHPFLAVRVSYERLSSRTGTAEGDSDGDFKLGGPALSLRARYPNETRFTPGAAAGVIWYGARFEEEGRWGNGFRGDDEGRAEYRDWRAQGSPPWPNNGYQRRIETESRVFALELAATLEVALDECWRIEAFARYVRVNVRGHYTLRNYGQVTSDRGWHDFPHDHIAFGLGLLYEF